MGAAFNESHSRDLLIKYVADIADALCGEENPPYAGGDVLRHSLGRIADSLATSKPITDGAVANQAPSVATTGSGAADDLNSLIIKLKDAGVMVPDEFTMAFASVTDSVAGHADRQYNTNKIASVAESDGTITITLAAGTKVADLKNFDGGSGWGVHKWLGIGVGAGISPITGLYYNGTKLTAEDVSEATTCGLSAGYFVRWVAADLVLAGDDTQKSKGNFKLRADGYKETTYTLKIVEG